MSRAARAAVATLAREGEQVSVRTGCAADAGEAVLEDAAREDLSGHLPDDGTPPAVLAGEALVVDRLHAVQVI